MNETDKEIIRRVLNGDTRAFGLLVDRHKAKAMTLAVRILKNREDAEEALQDAFVRIYRALHSFEWKSSFSTWMYRIVYNTCMTKIGKREDISWRSIDSDEKSEPLTVESDDMTPDIRLESDEFVRIVHEEVEKLPAVYGSTFTLFVIQEMSYEEIVGVTGLPLGTIKARIFRARALLRDAIVKRTRMVLV
jgi:RNA polymerase sigma-70 factor, ECF subfamily